MTDGKRIVWSIIWALVLIFLAWPIATFLSWFWIILMPFESFIPALKDVNVFLEKLITWPRMFGDAIRDGHQNFPTPFDSISSAA